MQYALLIYDRPGTYDELPDREREAVFGEYFAISNEASVVGGAQLEPAETATTIRVKDGETLATDGPFAEVKEYLAGFYLVECDSMERAVEIAGRVPEAELGLIEVRPVLQLGGMEM